MPKVYKMTVDGLRKLIAEERDAFQEAAKLGQVRDVEKVAKPKEVDADGYADTLEKDIDHYKAERIKEAKLIKELKRLRESIKVRQRRIQEARSAKK